MKNKNQTVFEGKYFEFQIYINRKQKKIYILMKKHQLNKPMEKTGLQKEMINKQVISKTSIFRKKR